MPLTVASIRAAAAGARPYKVADGGGLHLHVATTGTKTFRMAFRFGGKAQLLTFGRAGEISLQDARDRRDQARLQLRQGINPAGARGRAIAAAPAALTTFEGQARAWHAQQLRRWSTVHAADVIASLETHVFPAIGERAIAELTSAEILRVVRRIEDTGSIETARRVRQRISAVFAWAMAEDLVATDPAAIVGRALAPKPDARHYPAALEIGEAREVLAAVRGSGIGPAVLAAGLLALTAVRWGALRGARWDEIDMDLHSHDANSQGTWRIPSGRMKLVRGRKGNAAYDHVVPLSHQALELLRAARAAAGDSPLVFPRRRGGTAPIGVNAVGDLHRAAGVAGRHAPHGWRASFSTIMNERRPGDRWAIDLALAHAPKDRVQAAYNRAQLLQLRRDLLQDWADLLCGGRDAAPVLPLGRR